MEGGGVVLGVVWGFGGVVLFFGRMGWGLLLFLVLFNGEDCDHFQHVFRILSSILRLNFLNLLNQSPPELRAHIIISIIIFTIILPFQRIQLILMTQFQLLLRKSIDAV